MTWELFALLVLIIGAILLGGDWLARKHEKVQRDLEAFDDANWRSDCDRALDRRRAELDMATRERFSKGSR